MENNTLSYTLFIGDNCLGCKQILSKLKKLNININVININSENPKLPFPIIIVPALVKDDKLIGYGADIITYFKNKIKTS